MRYKSQKQKKVEDNVSSGYVTVEEEKGEEEEE
eukprot:CAMPEP_0202964408 /NCGR_PEP_ID=MMETSP1396-20130829/8485_1 /ASSEMBLY_ACC=CAM_ASM_000872 /TAXON_ID= /ORGANISM="Pseudokeronopsis sp., Strain Brazil" /LENGTH=32 /DNA_ID= /DNA_START= /DNA_END= /DNA_ORIENTATION=